MTPSASAVSSAREALASAVPALAAAGCETPRLDAEVLLADALGTDRMVLVANPAAPVLPPAGRTFAAHVRRRLAREPVAYITGRKGFRHIELVVDRRVLVPRPETELLVEITLELPEGARVHEVGTGSGAVALALLDERPDLRVSASDVSADAVAVARENASRLGLRLDARVAPGLPAEAAPGLPAEAAPGLPAEAAPELPLELAGSRPPGATTAPGRPAAAPDSAPPDLVLANLPYVRSDELAGLAPEIRDHEPRIALLGGGDDGLDAIRALVSGAPSNTLLALEHAPAQAAAVRALLVQARTRRDLAGCERATIGRAP